MLNVLITVKNQTIEMPPLYLGQGASMTDYSKKEIIHFMVNEDGIVDIFTTPEDAAITFGIYRRTDPKTKPNILKKLMPNENWDLPFTSKYGEALLRFKNMPED